MRFLHGLATVSIVTLFTVSGASSVGADPPPTNPENLAPAATSVASQRVTNMANMIGTAETPSNLRNRYCSTARKVLDRFPVDSTRVVSNDIVRIGTWDAPVRSTAWQAEHPTNPTLTVIYHSAAWLIPNKPSDLPQYLDLFVEQALNNPDPGSQAEKNILGLTGWKEAHVTKRLSTALCFYSATDDAGRAKLMPAISQLVNANLDPNRYYGPPNKAPHNHGVMADEMLYSTGVLVGREDWKDTARERVTTQFNASFDSCGMNFEQSSTYQRLHVRIWQRVSNWAELDPQIMKKIEAALIALTRPDGVIELIGDSSEPTGNPIPALPAGSTVFHCPTTGWSIFRSLNSQSRQYGIVRHGPSQKMHGHADRGAATWWVSNRAGRSQSVLADRGLYSKERNSTYDHFTGSAGHSTLQWEGGTAGNTTGRATRNSTATKVTTRASSKVGNWQRTVTYRSQALKMTVRDAVSGPASTGQPQQRFALDPAWKNTRTPGTYTTSKGDTLTISCTANGQPVQPRALKVRHSPDAGQMVSALSVDCGPQRPGATKAGGTLVLSATLSVVLAD